MSSKNIMVSLAAGVIAVLASTPVSAETSGNFAVTSDYVFRGISQTLENPAVSAGFDYSNESGFYAGIWGSNVDFVESPSPDDGADIEIDVYAGYGKAINDQWSWSVGYLQYIYPGTEDGVEYDFGEVQLGLDYEDWLSFFVGYSNDVLNSSETGIYYSASASWPLSDQFALNGTAGYYDLDDLGDASYSHGSLGVAWSYKSYTVDVTAHYTDADDIFGDIADSRVVLTFATGF